MRSILLSNPGIRRYPVARAGPIRCRRGIGGMMAEASGLTRKASDRRRLAACSSIHCAASPRDVASGSPGQALRTILHSRRVG